MQELRFVAVSEDGSYAILGIPGRSDRFMLPIDDRLRAVARGQFARLAQYEIEVENPLRPKEIQARIRAGETAEEIADAAGVPVERIRWFEGPVLAERAYMATQAQAASVRRPGDATPGPPLGEIVTERLSELGADPDDTQWDSRKLSDGRWQVRLSFTASGQPHAAEWLFEPARRHVTPVDENAARLCLPTTELPSTRAGALDRATVTPLRFRQDPPEPARRSVVPDEDEPVLPSSSTTRGSPPPDRETGPATVPPHPAPPTEPHRMSGENPDDATAGDRSPAAPPDRSGEGHATEDTQRTPSARRSGSRGRRSSVPSWDEIMLGNSRHHE